MGEAAKPVVTLTPSAWRAVWDALEASDGSSLTYHPSDFTDHYLRVGIHGGGCSGFAYDLDLEAGQPRAGWLVWHQADPHVHNDDCHPPHRDPPVRLACDPVSSQYLRGTTIDYVKVGLQSGFRFTNPLAKSTCGCGHSFQA